MKYQNKLKSWSHTEAHILALQELSLFFFSFVQNGMFRFTSLLHKILNTKLANSNMFS